VRELSTLSGCTIAGRYDLLEMLGSAAFGGVFRAQAPPAGRAMDEMTDSAARAHLVPIYDGGVAPAIDHRAYLVMELVPGTRLAAQFASYQANRFGGLLRHETDGR
jgi:hypothetical protein